MTDEKTGHRPVRSFVRREGRLTDGQRQALEAHWPIYGLDRSAGILDLDSIFGRAEARTLEIGFGNGQTLFRLAQNNPDIGFIGIEVYKTGVARLLREASANGLGNLKVYCDDAVEVIDQCLPDACLDTVQLYFPDPWHKKRHHKRRLVQPEFADRIARVLKPGGQWLLATDWQNYAEHMLDVLNPHSAFENMAPSGDYVPRPAQRDETRFERRGLDRGHGVWDLAFRRI